MPRTAPHVLALALCYAVSAPAHAGIAELLLKKGVITQAEYDELKREQVSAASVAPVVTPGESLNALQMRLQLAY